MRVQPIMKWSFLFGLLLMGGIAFSQSSPNTKGTDEQRKASLLQANDVTVAAAGRQSPAFQAQNWGIEAAQNPSNASAWLNYYLWTSRDKNLNASEKAARLSQITSNATSYSAKTSDYFLLQYLQSGKKDSTALHKAFDLSADKPTLYQYKIQYAIIHNYKALVKKYSFELNALMPMPSDLHEYHYNVLMSADSNAIIYAQGLNDLVALAFLQKIRNYRKDIKLKYYDGLPINEANAYLCLSLGADVLKKYPAAGYTGLLLKVSGASIEEVKRCINRFDLRIMQSDNEIPGSDAPAIYKNYIPGFLLLYKYLKETSDASLADWKFLIKRLAERTGNAQAVIKQLED
jgi:hypothetical protein